MESRATKPGDTLIGQVLFDDFAVLGVVGEGSLGKLYKVRQLSTNRLAAMKTLRVLKPSVLDKFSQAVEEHRNLQHKYIVESYDCRRTDIGRVYFITEFIEGISLKELLDEVGHFSKEDEMVHVMRQVAEALKYAHDRGILHLSLRPSQVLLTEADGEVSVKLTDFAMEHVRVDLESVTGEFAVMENLIYYSPEFLDESRPRQQADIYSFGVMIFKAMTGSYPFAGASYGEILSARKSRGALPLAIETFRPDLKAPKLFDELMQLSLAYNPGDRLRSMDEFIEHLDKWSDAVEKEKEEERLSTERKKAERKQVIEDLKQSVHDIVSLKQTQISSSESLVMKISDSLASKGPRLSPKKSVAKIAASLVWTSTIFLVCVYTLIVHHEDLRSWWVDSSMRLSGTMPRNRKNGGDLEDRKVVKETMDRTGKRRLVSTRPSGSSPLVKSPQKAHGNNSSFMSGANLKPGDEWPKHMLLKPIPYTPQSNPAYGVTNNMRR